MAKLITPSGISHTTNKTQKTLTLTWNKASDYANIKNFEYKFVNKDDSAQIKKPTPAETADRTVTTDKVSVIFTFATPEALAAYDNYIAQIKALPVATTDTESDWGKETYWIAGPWLTVQIGESSYTLTKGSSSTSTVYRLPASPEAPIKITYEDMKTFAASLALTLPDKYPNGSNIDASLDISELIIDTGKGLFSVSIALNVEWKIIEGLKINKLGIAVKRTDGSL